jgi:hypothetical protein
MYIANEYFYYSCSFNERQMDIQKSRMMQIDVLTFS